MELVQIPPQPQYFPPLPQLTAALVNGLTPRYNVAQGNATAAATPNRMFEADRSYI